MLHPASVRSAYALACGPSDADTAPITWGPAELEAFDDTEVGFLLPLHVDELDEDAMSAD